MQDCWQENPDDRPIFENLRNDLKEMENQHQVEYLQNKFKQGLVTFWFRSRLIDSLFYFPYRGSSTCSIMTTSFTQAWIRLLFKNCGSNSYHHRRKPSLPHTPNNRNFKTRCVLMLNPVPFIMQLTTKGSTLPIKRRKSRSKVIRCC